MVPRVIKISTNECGWLDEFSKNDLTKVASILARGGVIVFPTETLYGLGADYSNPSAVSRIIELKGRPEGMPIALALSNINQAKQLARISEHVSEIILALIGKPLTFLVPVKPGIDRDLTGGSKLIGLRFPTNPVTKVVLDLYGPLTATSANVHGGPDPVSIEQALDQFGNKVDMYIDTGPCEYGQGSTVIDISSETIKIIRHGACSGEEIQDLIRRL